MHITDELMGIAWDMARSSSPLQRQMHADYLKAGIEAALLAALTPAEPPVDAGSPYLCPKCSSHTVPHIVSGMGLRATCACGFSGGEHEFTATAEDR